MSAGTLVHGHDEAYEPVFVGERRKELDELMTRYPTKMACLLPALWMVQETRGWVSESGMAEVADVLELTPAYVKGVVTFYTMYHTKPVGRHVVDVCTTVSCWLRGSDELVKHIEGKLGIKVGDTTADGRVTLRTVECLGSCGTAPMCQIGNDYHENLTHRRMDEVLETLR